MRCSKCKSFVAAGSKFCPQCGANVSDAVMTDFLVRVLTAPVVSDAEMEEIYRQDPELAAIHKALEKDRKKRQKQKERQTVDRKRDTTSKAQKRTVGKWIGGFFGNLFK